MRSKSAANERRFLATGAAADFHDRFLVIVRIAEQRRARGTALRRRLVLRSRFSVFMRRRSPNTNGERCERHLELPLK
jgi:hypothetical protein